MSEQFNVYICSFCIWTSLCCALPAVLSVCFNHFSLWMWHVTCETVPCIWVRWSCVCQLDCFWDGSTGALLSLPDTPHPLWCPTSPQPFLPSALQDIYELKDQIQDVEGRYMQGLKELKVEGLELTACLLLFSGSSMASLTLQHSLYSYPSVPSPVAPHATVVSLRAPSVNCVMIPSFAWSSLTSCFDPTHWLWPKMKTLPQFSWVQSCKKKS